MTSAEYELVTAPPPDRTAKIWRFMSIAELVSLLSKRALFFTRPDKLEDQFEGSLPKLVVTKAEVGFEKLTPMGQTILRDTRQHYGYLQSKLWTMVNCWYLNEHESAAMWKLHAADGISIQSTFERFVDAVAPATRKIYLGQVRYLDYEKEGWDISADPRTIWSIFHKRKSFEHENEFRAAICEPIPGGIYNCAEGPGYVSPNGTPGMSVQVDLGRLIEKIHVAPGSPPWIQDVVKTITDSYDLGGAVVSSQLDITPLW